MKKFRSQLGILGFEIFQVLGQDLKFVVQNPLRLLSLLVERLDFPGLIIIGYLESLNFPCRSFRLLRIVCFA